MNGSPSSKERRPPSYNRTSHSMTSGAEEDRRASLRNQYRTLFSYTRVHKKEEKSRDSRSCPKRLRQIPFIIVWRLLKRRDLLAALTFLFIIWLPKISGYVFSLPQRYHSYKREKTLKINGSCFCTAPSLYYLGAGRNLQEIDVNSWAQKKEWKMLAQEFLFYFLVSSNDCSQRYKRKMEEQS